MHETKHLIYAGKVDHGFDAASAKELQAQLKLTPRAAQPLPHRSKDRSKINLLANWATRLFKTVASKTQFNGVGRLRTYISLTHLAL